MSDPYAFFHVIFFPSYMYTHVYVYTCISVVVVLVVMDLQPLLCTMSIEELSQEYLQQYHDHYHHA